MSSASGAPGPLRSLVGHGDAVDAATPLEEVHRRFAETRRDFLAVLEGPELIGVCARRAIAMLLGARFGFALYARRPVREHLVSAPLRLTETSPLPEVLAAVAGRSDEFFFDDVVLVDAAGGFIGFIFVHALVRLQTELMLRNIAALETSRRDIADKNRALEADLAMAREVQLAMLPAVASAAGPLDRWRGHAYYAPASGVGGDFFQLLRISETVAGLLVCDVMGHGVRSALVTALVRAFAENLRAEALDPGALLTRLNLDLMGVLRQTGRLLFVTAAYVVIDTAEGTLRYGQAGHPTGFLRRAAGTVELLPAEGDVPGPALGLIAGFPYAAGTTPIAAGDWAVIFTDGIFEVRNADGEEWGRDRLRAELGRSGIPPGEELLRTTVASASRFAGTGTFEDDVCLAALEFAAGA